MSRVNGFLLFALVVTLAVDASLAAGSEQINRYESQIDVNENGSLRVTETINVTAAGRRIKRGIYRDFPTVYKTRYFVKTQVPFDVVSVTRDGQPEPFHTERKSNGIRVYMGQEDTRLEPGSYTYQIVYTTNFQLGYFDNHDELYWNVTGNGWEFAIEQATASVRLPADVPLDEVKREGYTGPQGSKARNLTSSVDAAAGTIGFATTRPLGPREGLTIVVEFPKGYVREPTAAERRNMFFRANLTLWAMLGGLIVLLAYHLWAWLAVGRDPPGDVIIPQFEPPLDLPPACARYLRRMGYDRKCFTAAILDAAVKGQVTIEENAGVYKLIRTGNGQARKLSPGERAAINTLLPKNAKAIRFVQTNHQEIKSAIGKLGEWLSKEFDGKLFRKNRGYLVPGWLIAALVLAGVALSSDPAGLPVVGFMAIWLSGWTIGCAVLAWMVISSWRSVVSLRRSTLGRLGSLGGALFITAFAIPFFVGEIVGIGVLVANTSIWIVPVLVGVVAIVWSFWYLIKQPTVEGRRVMDQIEGFRMYLSTAEKEYLDKLHPPERTPELFEKYLPYALALDVENQWSEQFADVLARASVGSNGEYRPNWYQGSGWHAASAGTFASGLGSSLSNAISSSSTAPGSSSGGSGSSGGGFSGGGGGGGGGGGW